MKPKFIYFDIGGVSIRDFSKTNKWQKMLEGLGIPEGDRPEVSRLWKKHEGEVCVGRDADELAEWIFKQIGLKTRDLRPVASVSNLQSQDYSILQDFADRFERNDGLLNLIQKIRSKYKLGLLTNIYPRMLEKLHDTNLLPRDGWDAIVDSSVIKMRKPDLEIYEYAEEKSGYSGNEILFIDNKAENLEMPKKLGWQTFLYDPGDVEGSNQKLVSIVG